MTTCPSWYGKEKAEEPGYLRTKDTRTSLTGARAVLQDAAFMGSSYFGQRGAHKESRAGVLSMDGMCLLVRENFCGLA